ncbi:hypothetical protein FACS1894201_08780 [Bacteroidia bacterium]|nr:hypothetical protein FACS1894201_08780 [Bacteroidia bacterium]
MKYSKRYIIVAIGFLCATQVLFGQREVMRETETDKTYAIVRHGPNRTWHSWVEMEMGLAGLIVPVETWKEALTSPTNFRFSFSQKLKLNSVFSVGYTTGFVLWQYPLSKEEIAMISGGWSADWDKANFLLTGAHAGAFLRINFDPKRGNITGNYVDIGCNGWYNFRQRQRYKTTHYKETFYQGDFIQRYATALSLNYGYQIFSLQLRYLLQSQNDKLKTLIYDDAPHLLAYPQWMLSVAFDIPLD